MDLSSFLLRLIFLALPGIIGSLLYRKLRGSKQQKNWQDVIEIILFSLLSYSLYGLVVEVQSFLRLGTASFTSLQALFDEELPIRWYEIFFSSVFGVLLAFAATYAHKYKMVNKFGRWIGATNRFGDEDVWDFFHNSTDIDAWIFLRDHKLDLVYFGWIEVFSDSEKERELLLRDVKVYSNTTGEHLYDASVIYIARDRYDLTLEVPMAEQISSETTQTINREAEHGQGDE